MSCQRKQPGCPQPCIDLVYDDVTKWKHFPLHWPFVRGINRWSVNSPHKGQWRGALIFSLICVWTNGWTNHRDVGNLRRHRAYNDVIVMSLIMTLLQCLSTAPQALTHWGRDKIAASFADDIFICIFFNENFRISNKISLKYVPWGIIVNKPSMV